MSVAANAGVYGLNFGGGGVSGTLALTYAANTNTGVIPGDKSPNSVDPIGSYIVTNASGMFSDSNIGVSNAAITGVVASNPALPEPKNYLAPHSFGWYPIASGNPQPGGGSAPGFSYDDLFYPNGSPQTGSDYPFKGGIFDVYGIVVTLANGDAVDLWSNGYIGGHISYGAGVTDGRNVLDYATIAAPGVPEAAAWAMMLTAFGAVGVSARRRRAVVASC